MTRRRFLLFVLLGLAATPPARAQVELLPNLQPVPPLDPYLVPGFPSGVQLRFGTLTSNKGLGAAEIRGGDVVGETQEVWQCVYTDIGTCNLSFAGSFIFHPEHGHIHFENYARYSLDSLDATLPVSGVSGKISFCLLDSDELAGRFPGEPRKAFYTTCGAVRQGISVGWTDLYGALLPGQSIDVTGFPAGEYRLSIEVDPENRLRELDDADNTSSLLIHMNPETLTLEVLGEVDPGALTLTAMAPNQMSRGQSIEIRITGSGFDPSLPVGFTGASGAPKLSNAILESSSSIRATVTAGTGGPSRARTYDLQVGRAVLQGALTIVP